jgi:hypothetical protein
MASQLHNQRRVNALFRALASDYLLREQFVTDPAQILMEYVSGKRLEPEAAAAANQLVYAMVSNPRLLRWLTTYGREHTEVPTGEAFARDFAHALARDGDEQTLLALVRAANESQALFSIQAQVLRGLINALGAGRGGPVFAGTEMSSPGTEISPGPGTEMSPGHLGDIDIDVTLRALVDFANELRRAGTLNTLGFQ